MSWKYFQNQRGKYIQNQRGEYFQNQRGDYIQNRRTNFFLPQNQRRKYIFKIKEGNILKNKEKLFSRSEKNIFPNQKGEYI